MGDARAAGRGGGNGLRVVALVLVALLACSQEPAPEPEPGSTSKPELLYYAARTSLFSLDVESRERTEVAELPSADVAVSPDGSRYVYVQESAPAGSEAEGFADPALHSAATDGGDTTALGPGHSPLWSPSGALAAVNGDSVVVYEPGATEPRTVLAGGRWELIGWTAGAVLAVDTSARSIFLGTLEGDPVALGLSPALLWGVSPAERKLLIVARGGVAELRGFGELRESTTLDLGGDAADGTWSPSGDRIALVVVTGRGAAPSSRLVVVDATSGEVSRVPGGTGAQGNVVWSSDGSAFAYVRTMPSRPGRLQAVMCDAEMRCDPLFSWIRGLSLLSLTKTGG